MPSVIYSDNFKTFKATHVKLLSIYQHSCPDWKFIAPKSPWRGGWWERLVKSVKAALRKSLGNKILTRTELETTIHEVESCINSRPLTVVSDDVECVQPLTPSQFLLSKSSVLHPADGDSSSSITGKHLRKISDCRENMMDQFWEVWSNDYVRNLPPFKGHPTRDELTVGSVVLVRQEGLPRMRWLVGRVIKVYPSIRDGIIRTVDVKTSKGVFTRPIQLLHRLEVENSASDVPDRDLLHTDAIIVNKIINPNFSSHLDSLCASVPDVNPYQARVHPAGAAPLTQSDQYDKDAVLPGGKPAQSQSKDAVLPGGKPDQSQKDAVMPGGKPVQSQCNAGSVSAAVPTPISSNIMYKCPTSSYQPWPVRVSPPTDTAGVIPRPSKSTENMLRPVRVAPSTEPAVESNPRPPSAIRPQYSRYGRRLNPVKRL